MVDWFHDVTPGVRKQGAVQGRRDTAVNGARWRTRTFQRQVMAWVRVDVDVDVLVLAGPTVLVLVASEAVLEEVYHLGQTDTDVDDKDGPGDEQGLQRDANEEQQQHFDPAQHEHQRQHDVLQHSYPAKCSRRWKGREVCWLVSSIKLIRNRCC